MERKRLAFEWRGNERKIWQSVATPDECYEAGIGVCQLATPAFCGEEGNEYILHGPVLCWMMCNDCFPL